jgi:uncharacterized membrane protein YfcA
MQKQDTFIDGQRWQRSCSLVFAIIVAAFLLWNDGRLDPRNRVLQDHASLFPFTSRDAWAFFLASLGLVIAAGGGIGGGGMLVPTYILILQFPAKHAIPLSNVTVFGGAVANTALNVKKRHPLADRPLIDWDLILVMEPLTILGALVGTNLNKILPETIIVVLLVVLLSFIAYKTLKNAVEMYEKEGWAQVESTEDDLELVESENDLKVARIDTAAFSKPYRLTRRVSGGSFELRGNLLKRSNSVRLSSKRSFSPELQLSPDVSEEAIASFGDFSVGNQSFGGSLMSVSLEANAQADVTTSESQESPSPVLARLLEEERHAPTRNVYIIIGMFLVVLLVNILKGSGAFPSPLGIECGSLSFWLTEASLALGIVVVSLSARSSLLQRTRQKQVAGYQYLDCDIEWNGTSTIVYPLLSCTAGFVAGLFGIGGGIIKGPLMLALGVHPAVASATSACMILFTSFTATTSFAVFGLLIEDYAILCLFTGFCATLLGQTIMSMILEKYQHNSYIAFCIGSVVLLSAICMTLESAISILQSGGSRQYSGLCVADLE